MKSFKNYSERIPREFGGFLFPQPEKVGQVLNSSWLSLLSVLIPLNCAKRLEALKFNK